MRSIARLVHWCRGKQCCKNRAESVSKATEILLSSVLRGLPPVPMPSRWTRVMQTVLWYYIVSAYCGLHHISIVEGCRDCARHL